MNERYTVRRTRTDGSVTFNGDRLSLAQAERERDAWHETGRIAEIVSWDDAKAEMKSWRKVVRTGRSYFPEEVKS